MNVVLPLPANGDRSRQYTLAQAARSRRSTVGSKHDRDLRGRELAALDLQAELHFACARANAASAGAGGAVALLHGRVPGHGALGRAVQRIARGLRNLKNQNSAEECAETVHHALMDIELVP